MGRQVFTVKDSQGRIAGVAYVDADGGFRAGLPYVAEKDREAVRQVVEWYANHPDRKMMQSVNTVTGHQIINATNRNFLTA